MTHQPPPLITIIIAVYNGAKTLQQCIDSVAQQTYANKELIIIDGGSNDGTVELLKANDQHINYWISEPDQGIYNAWNKGLAQAQGEWICFLGADDFFWDTQVLEKISKPLATLPASIRVAYGQIMLLNSKDEDLYLSGEPWQNVKKRFKQIMSIPHPGTLHRRSLFEQHGRFDESFRIAGDYELLLRELKTADAAFIPDVITVAMRQGGISSDPQNALVQLREVRRGQRIQGLNFPGVSWLMAIARVYIRLLLWQFLGEQAARKTLDWGRRMLGLPAFWTRT
ncbi:MAG: glycosyltransferase family 2 protein [Methylobacter sp.]|nr:glycosyltransferase family 2 protein [Methylococcales bacterium]MDP2100509.1 glycosyltransferase family 2 protein [Methylobacter sp.]MDP2428738.1 glycosyltransferase family 2 protein [Methylobacter sp.]MDP3053246.1 glycosyltransferase family 2 protein [Methylobacter sp.]MDP3361555.1 glycosyltransferase family 2 protein [Methylobacter sp.]